jgi:hypothetical protein
MGYTTKFIGHITLSRPLTMGEAKELLEFNEEPERIKDAGKLTGYMQWVPSETLDAIVWDQQEKFYDYEEWMAWLLRWLDARGIQANGVLDWRGEDSSDIGRIIVKDSAMTTEQGVTTKASSHKPMTLDKLARMALEAATA